MNMEMNEINPGELEGAAGGTEQIYIIYTVAKGDNLTRIARKYGVTIEQLVTWNNIANANLIFPGQQIKIYQ